MRVELSTLYEKGGKTLNRSQRMGINFVYKVVFFPAILFALARWAPQAIAFESWWPIAVISALFVCVGVVADELILPVFGNMKATSQGFVFMSVVLWLAPYVFAGVRVTAGGALLAGLVLSLAEFGMHGWILQQRQKEQKKDPSLQ